jgi:two-component system, NtrC family, sensor kinase
VKPIRVASLFVIQGRDQGKRFELPEGALTIGREAGSGIHLADTEVSRRHAEIVYENRGYTIVDQASANGVFVNSQRQPRWSLRTGDRIQLGRTLLLFTNPDESGSSGKPSVEISKIGTESPSQIVKSASVAAASAAKLSSDSQAPWLSAARSHLRIMYDTAMAVSHTLDIDQLLARILELIFGWVEADRGCIMLLDRATEEIKPAARRNRRPDEPLDKMVISRTILDYVMKRKEGVITSDAAVDQRFEAAASIVTAGVREALCVPMQGRYGVVGAIYIDTYMSPTQVAEREGENRFNEEHLQFMAAIGHQAALAIEDTYYYSSLLQAERLAAVGQTIATLSHHIKNILQGMRGGGYLVDQGLKNNDGEAAQRGWKIVERNQDRIASLVMDMLSYGKDREPDMSMSDLNEVVDDVAQILAPRAAELGLELVVVKEGSMPLGMFDSEGLHRAILNVASNAVDACEGREKGRVEIASRYDGPRQRLAVVIADNGVGIAADRLAKIFSIFESTKGNRGTGLGLAVSQKILNEHGGEIRVDSRVGEGSTFVLEIPHLAPDQPQTWLLSK